MAIELVRGRPTAIISAAVTGKIDVRSVGERQGDSRRFVRTTNHEESK